jgi:hypothetical protein
MVGSCEHNYEPSSSGAMELAYLCIIYRNICIDCT